MKKYLLYAAMVLAILLLGLGVGYLLVHWDLVTQKAAFGGINDLKYSRISDSSVQISFTTGRPVAATLEYGTTELYGVKISESTPSTAHDFAVAGLLPGRDHNFRVLVSSLGGRTFTTPNFVIKSN